MATQYLIYFSVFLNLSFGLSSQAAPKQAGELPVVEKAVTRIDGERTEVSKGTVFLGFDDEIYIVDAVHPGGRLSVYRTFASLISSKVVTGNFVPQSDEPTVLRSLDDIKAIHVECVTLRGMSNGTSIQEYCEGERVQEVVTNGTPLPLCNFKEFRKAFRQQGNQLGDIEILRRVAFYKGISVKGNMYTCSLGGAVISGVFSDGTMVFGNALNGNQNLQFNPLDTFTVEMAGEESEGGHVSDYRQVSN